MIEMLSCLGRRTLGVAGAGPRSWHPEQTNPTEDPNVTRVDDHAKHGFFALALALLQMAAGPVYSQPETSPSFVNCYDKAREMVMRTRREDCSGRTVEDAEAAAIRDRRRSYVQESVEAHQNSTIIGKRLSSIGAGFFVDKGTLLTNAHVVKDCTTLTASLAEGGMQSARLIVSDPRIDLALLATDIRPGHSAVFAPPEAPLSTEIAIVGYPSQGLPPIRPLLTSGTLVHSQADTSTQRPLTLKAEIRPGNSGGPVLDRAGRVVGVVFAAVDTPAVYERTGSVVRDVGVAIPNSLSLGFLERSHISPEIVTRTDPLANLLDDANSYVVRIECWR